MIRALTSSAQRLSALVQTGILRSQNSSVIRIVVQQSSAHGFQAQPLSSSPLIKNPTSKGLQTRNIILR